MHTGIQEKQKLETIGSTEGGSAFVWEEDTL